MLFLVLCIVIALSLFWFAGRLAAWFIIWLGKRVAGLDIRIKTVGFFTFHDVQLASGPGFSVEIEKAWLSSRYFCKDTTKPLGVCVSDVRVQGELRAMSRWRDSQHHYDDVDRMAARKHHLLISLISTLLQFVGLNVYNLHVILLKGVFYESMLHVTIHELIVHYAQKFSSTHINIDIDSFNGRILKSPSRSAENVQEENCDTCLAELSFSYQLGLVLKPAVKMQIIKSVLEKPHLMVTEALFVELLKVNQQTVLENQGASTGSSSLVRRMKQISITDLDLQVNNAEVIVCKNSGQRSLCTVVKSLTCSFHQPTDKTASTQTEAVLLLAAMNVRSQKVQFLNLSHLSLEMKADDETMNVSCCTGACFLGHHREEVLYWLCVLSKLLPTHTPVIGEQTRTDATVSTGSRNFIYDYISKRTTMLSLQADMFSAAIATATCAGLKGGFSKVKFVMSIKPHFLPGDAFRLADCDVRCDFEVALVYCKLAEGSVSSSELSSKLHHTNTLLYLQLFMLNVNQLAQHVSVDCMLDSVQMELSTACLSVLSTMSGAMKGILPDRPAAADAVPVGAGFRLASFDQLNLRCTSVNLFLCTDYKVYAMLRVDSIECSRRLSDGHADIDGIKAVYLPQLSQSMPVIRCQDLHDYVLYVKHIEFQERSSNRALEVKVKEEVYFLWTYALHLCLYQVYQDLDNSKQKMGIGHSKGTSAHSSSQWSMSCINVNVLANTTVALQLSNGHRVIFSTPELSLQLQQQTKSVSADQFSITLDQHEIFKLQGTRICLEPHSEQGKLERASVGKLILAANRTCTVDFQQFHVIFPHGYNFAECFEEVKNLNKWRKLVHKTARKPFTIDSPLPPDLVIRAQSVILQLTDDPFEVKLGDNYELIMDEHVENEKRLQAMDKRIQELRRKHGLLPGRKIEELYTSLDKMSSEVYVQRSCQLYNTSPMRTKLFTWTMGRLEVIALADLSLHGKENAVRHMRDMDKDSPYPDEGLEFSSLWCRMVIASVASWTIQLRDFPQPMLEVDTMHVWGRLVGAEQAALPRAKRVCVVEVGGPWQDMTVERSMPSMKFYHDFSCEANVINMAYGACWEPTMAQYNLNLNMVNRPSIDPSRPMPFWDKWRLLLHGRLTMAVQKMSWLYHASLDPYNTTELMDWTWSTLILDWTNGRWVLKGDLDIYARTASKYDDCRLLHLPNLRFCVRLDWMCLGDPNDHHAVMPCAPDKIPEYGMQEHDSYRAFRSQKLNLSVSYETKPCENGDVPSLSFYSSSLRWLDKIKTCLLRVSRPIKRGKLFNYTPPRKAQLGRHYNKVQLSFRVPQFQVFYWISFAKQHGFEMRGESFALSVGFQLSLLSIEDGLRHRPRADWAIKQFSCELNDATLWLCSVNRDGAQDNVPIQGTANKSYFASVEKFIYQRAEERSAKVFADNEQAEQDDDPPTHRVHIHNMKGSWTPSNRNVALSLYDGYTKAQTIRKCLSAEALQAFKVETNKTPQKVQRVAMTSTPPLLSGPQPGSTPSPWSKLQSGPALAMLKKLISESDSHFVAVHEELSGGIMPDQLHGIAACQTTDVVRHNWHIQFHNSQVMLKGCETPGYVIVSAAAASILSCDHRPVWKQQQLRRKTTWVGSIECMQYYATVDPGSDSDNEKIMWLSKENVEDRTETAVPMTGIAAMLGSGLSVGGVVSDPLAAMGQTPGSRVQLQRIISRCSCQFFYADYGEVDDNTLSEVPALRSDDPDMLKREEAIDSFTLLHHDLKIFTNSLQYAMVLDIVNNLLLYVEPGKKELTEKLQNMHFQLQLCSIEDQKTPILHRQNNLRELVWRVRKLEREIYMVHRALDDDMDNPDLLSQRDQLTLKLYEGKEQVSSASEELAIMIRCFKDSQLQVLSQCSAAQSQAQATVVRQNEVCFKHAEWRMTEADGQIGIVDLTLRNFLYTKINRHDNSGSHQLELGWIKVINLLPDSPYKDLLTLQEPVGRGFSDHQVAMRILCKFKAPVGGISVKEQFEVNVVPICLQLTHRFYTTAMAFFFPYKQASDSDDTHDDGDVEPGFNPASSKQRRKDDRKPLVKHRESLKSQSGNDIDKMKERAARNNMFLYIKVPEVPLRVSYKGEKEKNLVADIHDFHFLLPTLEYHNQTWTWLDLLITMKNDCKRVMLSQAIKQKLHMRGSRTNDSATLPTDSQQQEDKAKLLLGAKLLMGNEKPASKKNLFGKSFK